MAAFTLNQMKVYRVLRKNGAMDRTDLVIVTGIPRSTVYGALIKLFKLGLITKFSLKRGGVGRPWVLWEVVRG